MLVRLVAGGGEEVRGVASEGAGARFINSKLEVAPSLHGRLKAA